MKVSVSQDSEPGMAADDELVRELQGDEDCDTEGIYQDVDKLWRVISRTDDEAGSYLCFGEA